ncbi:GL17529 [Drosophila persimilis]|uniref:GL17529 n=1 Tax=Drosophila persimilis TaxID=7234 RepID=B4GHI0_DROPE|nr:pyridoxal phosphate phosphatase [Drosophila persimilis]EDW35950.1 GL17529 [Drosophila persimilis]
MFKRSCTLLAEIPKQEVLQWLGSIETVLFGTDGVLWNFDDPIKGSVETFNATRNKGKRCFLVTNDSSMVASDMAQKAMCLGLKVGEQEILTSAACISNYLVVKKFKKKVLVVGETGIQEELQKAGIQSVTIDQEAEEHKMGPFARNLIVDPDVGAVVVGRDKSFNVSKIVVACTYLLNPKVMFLGTCMDTIYPVCEKRVTVGAAAMVAAIEKSSNRKPLIMGKPNPQMVYKLRQSGVLKPEKTLVIGDRLSSDIIFANNCGFKSLLVGSGAGSLEEAQQLKMEGNEKKLMMVPDTFLPSLGHLMEYLCEDEKIKETDEGKAEKKRVDNTGNEAKAA